MTILFLNIILKYACYASNVIRRRKWKFRSSCGSWYLAGQLEAEKVYSEAEINTLLDEWTIFHDPATLRRELFNHFLLNRTADGRQYWRAEEIPSLEAFLTKYL